MASSTTSLLSYLDLKSLGFWKILAIFFALLNLKQLPFAWHLRIISGLFQHIPWTSRPLVDVPSIGPAALFRPLILASRAAPLECDYNLHKSNSTYFADFDIGRLHLLIRLCHSGIAKTGLDLWKKEGEKGPRQLGVMMGGVNMNFRKEIKPGQAFEMWTRLLTWDRKWFFTVTHFVRKNTVKPKGWLLQPWRNKNRDKSIQTQQQSSRMRDAKGEDDTTGAERKALEKTGPHPAIFATGIAKYVFKRGRLTIPPELVLRNSGLLPPKPSDHETPPVSETPAMPIEGDALPTAGAAMQNLTSKNAEALVDEALNDPGIGDQNAAGEDRWDWDRVERERLKGMKIAEAWTKTEMLGEMFDGEEGMALGKYWDIP
ncbi:MAG: hypothetical protein Q9172_001176 [Xanthocarpia lactea]